MDQQTHVYQPPAQPYPPQEPAFDPQGQPYPLYDPQGQPYPPQDPAFDPQGQPFAPEGYEPQMQEPFDPSSMPPENGPYIVDGQPYAPREDYVYDDEYSDYDEQLDNTHRFHVAMNVFDTASVIAGLVVILVLVTLLISLITWVWSDISHSLLMFQSKI